MKDHFGKDIKVGDLVIIPFTPLYKPKSYTILKLGIVKRLSLNGAIVSFNDDSINRTKIIKDGQALVLFQKPVQLEIIPMNSDMSQGV